jgi:non-specific serine/threonine protein kinase
LLAEVRQRLSSERVVTLVGTGGIGKSRLAHRLAQAERGTFRDGCWLVDLVPVTSAALVSSTVATVLGLRAESGMPDPAWTTGRVADFVADREAILVLDGCEHVREAVADLVHRLRVACPRLGILVTSRRRLGISGEVVIRVPPLTVPDPGTRVPPEGLLQFEAVSLFVDRATFARADFRLSAGNAVAIAALCTGLEGNPLAIELAAARAGSLAPHTMLEQLTDRYRLLSGGPRDAPERHRSLSACVQWDYDLCTPPERALWARMTVFTGGCEWAAARSVCAGEEVDPDDVVPILSALAERSILLAVEEPDGRARYVLPPSLAEFGRKELQRVGQVDRWRGRHLDWCAALGQELRGQWVGDRQPELLRRATRAHADIRTALDYAVTGGADRAEDGLGLVTDLDSFWVTAGLAQEARHWLEATLATGCGMPADRALAMVLLARFCGLQHDLAPARAWAAQAAAATEDSDDRAAGLLGVFNSMIAAWEGRLQAAVEESERSVGLLHRAEDRAGELLARTIHGVCLGMAGDAEAAVSAFETAIDLAGETGEMFRRSFCLTGLGEQALLRGDPEQAEELFLEALRVKAELGDRFGVAVALDCLGRAAVARDCPRRAAILLGAAGSTWDSIGMSATGNPFASRSAPFDGIRQARAQLGKQAFREEFRRGSALSEEQAVTYALDDVDPGREPARAPSPLTRRETEVAELVAEGLSNPEIATRLVISVRTAQGHVENILRKLGFTSRAMIASWVTHRRAQHDQSAPAAP